MKAELSQIYIRITLPEGASSRKPFVIWVNPNHGTWGLQEGTLPYFCKADTDYISNIVGRTCHFAKELECL